MGIAPIRMLSAEYLTKSNLNNKGTLISHTQQETQRQLVSSSVTKEVIKDAGSFYLSVLSSPHGHKMAAAAPIPHILLVAFKDRKNMDGWGWRQSPWTFLFLQEEKYFFLAIKRAKGLSEPMLCCKVLGAGGYSTQVSI